jgi:FAD/FMN-containing dehydrogenase
MSKIAHYLQEHLVGEVMTSVDARRYFATDASIFVLAPALVVYPRNENDIRKTARFTWQLAERGRVIPITARGAGTDQSGAALGSGIMLVFPAHLNRILELDTKGGTVTVEPGINYGKLQQTLHTHGRFLPPYPASLEYSTVGGAVANNSGGEKSVKYGMTRNYVQSLRIVLANGEVMETGRLSKRELSKKLGLASFEGEIYRSIDTLLEESRELLVKLNLNVAQNNAGYNLLDVKHHDGSFDLTPLLVGSQGSLGIVSEVTLRTEVYNPQTTLFMATFETVQAAQEAVLDLLALSDAPSSIELINGHMLQAVQDVNPNLLKDSLTAPFPAIVLFVEFDNTKEHTQKKLTKKTHKIFEKHALSLQTETELERQQQLWKIREATATVLGNSAGQQRAVPIIDDAAIPVESYQEYFDGVYKLFEKAGLKPAVWGHAGGGSVHLQPLLNIGQVGDRQKAFRLMDDYYKFVIGLGGTPSGERNDGRLRAPYLEQLYGSEVYGIFQKVKQIFDPYSILNPGVKLGSSREDIKGLVRPDYNLAHFYDHLPHS